MCGGYNEGYRNVCQLDYQTLWTVHLVFTACNIKRHTYLVYTVDSKDIV